MKFVSKLGLFFFVFTMSFPVVAQQGEHMGRGTDGLAYLGAGIAIGLAILGAGLGQAKAAAAALEGIGRNPQSSDKVFTPLLIALGFIESLALFAFVIAYLLQSK